MAARGYQSFWRPSSRDQNAAPRLSVPTYARALETGIPPSVYSSYVELDTLADAASLKLCTTPSKRRFAGPRVHTTRSPRSQLVRGDSSRSPLQYCPFGPSGELPAV